MMFAPLISSSFSSSIAPIQLYPQRSASVTKLIVVLLMCCSTVAAYRVMVELRNVDMKKCYYNDEINSHLWPFQWPIHIYNLINEMQRQKGAVAAHCDHERSNDGAQIIALLLL
jgi:hypothetical protein